MSKFLSYDEIIEAVCQQHIKIAYYAIGSPAQPRSVGERRFVKPRPTPDDDDLDKAIRQFFLESLGPDSLTLHVGPYAVVEYARRGSRSKHVVNRSGQAILQVHAANQLLFFPGEFALVGSNEYIEVGGKIGASLFSNVRNTDVGLSHVSTIIDPTWEGRLQVGLTNLTRVSKEIGYLDALCIARFHVNATDPPQAVADRFRHDRPHFGEDWWTAERNKGRTLFPMRREFELGGSGAKQAAWEVKKLTAFAWLKGASALLGVSSVAVLIFNAVDVYRDVQQAKSYGEKIEFLQKDSAQLHDDSKQLSSILQTFHVVKSGSRQIRLDAASPLRFSVSFDERLVDPPVLLVGVEGLESSQYSVRIDYDREADRDNSISGATITIRPTDRAASGSKAIATWLFARKKL